jgi:hypothetical protein
MWNRSFVNRWAFSILTERITAPNVRCSQICRIDRYVGGELIVLSAAMITGQQGRLLQNFVWHVAYCEVTFSEHLEAAFRRLRRCRSHGNKIASCELSPGNIAACN